MTAARIQLCLWRVSLRQLSTRGDGRRPTTTRTVATTGVTGVACLAAAVLAGVALTGSAGRLPIALVLPWASAALVLAVAGTTTAAICSLTDDLPVRRALAALPIGDRSVMLGVLWVTSSDGTISRMTSSGSSA